MTLRVRAVSSSGDYTFGSNQWLVDSPGAVAQIIEQRFALFQNEWFLDSLAGTPWFQQILGRHASAPPVPGQASVSMTTYDLALKQVILNTPGVDPRGGLINYSSFLDGSTRALSVYAQVLTIFSSTPITVNATLPLMPPFTLGLTPLG